MLLHLIAGSPGPPPSPYDSSAQMVLHFPIVIEFEYSFDQKEDSLRATSPSVSGSSSLSVMTQRARQLSMIVLQFLLQIIRCGATCIFSFLARRSRRRLLPPAELASSALATLAASTLHRARRHFRSSRTPIAPTPPSARRARFLYARHPRRVLALPRALTHSFPAR